MKLQMKLEYYSVDQTSIQKAVVCKLVLGVRTAVEALTGLIQPDAQLAQATIHQEFLAQILRIMI